MKIHVWAQSYSAAPGGIQTFTRFVVQALRELYPEAEIVVFAKNDPREQIEEVDREVAVNDTRVAYGPKAQNERGVTGKEKVVREGAINNTRGACDPQADTKTDRPAMRVIGFGGWPGPLRAIAFTVGVIWRAAWTSQRDVPTVVLSTHVNFAPVGRLVKRLAKVSFAAVGHGIEVWNIHKASVREGLSHADQLIAVSQFTRTRMAVAIGIEEERIEILPNTFDADTFQPGPKPTTLLQRYDLTVDQPVILTVARLAETEQYKGYDNVLLALPAVLRQFPNARYLIVGGGPDRKRLGGLSQELGVEDKVIMAGYVPNEELSGHYNLCDLFVMPSKGEGFGIVFLEALSCGKPVIAGNKDASAEAVLDGKLGVLVDPDDVVAIGDAICRVLAASRGQWAQHGEQITENGEPQLEGELLRYEVIKAFGFERFRERLGAILAPLFVIR
jgi:glycosyltransferase involved in cell wall biosynthesis